jgi:hypothetical protein
VIRRLIRRRSSSAENRARPHEVDPSRPCSSHDELQMSIRSVLHNHGLFLIRIDKMSAGAMANVKGGSRFHCAAAGRRIRLRSIHATGCGHVLPFVFVRRSLGWPSSA